MTEPYAVTTDPADLIAALGLAAGRSYLLEVVQGNPAVRLFEGGAAAPEDRSYFHAICPGKRIGIKVAADKPVWVWAVAPSRLAVTELPS